MNSLQTASGRARRAGALRRGRPSPLLILSLAGVVPLLIWGAVLFSACKAENPVTSAAPPSSLAAPTAEPEAPAQVVEFASTDGLRLSGRLFGTGTRGVVLAHMYPADQTSWTETALRLAEAGYLVLTFDFRGYGHSQGDRDIAHLDRDVMGAVTYLGSQGATAITLIGASMGGTACLIAAEQAQPLSHIRLAGVAALSAPVEFKGLSAAAAVPRLVVPLLLVAAEKDAGAEGARALAALAGATANAETTRVQLHLLPGSAHGTDLVQGSQGETVYSLLLRFLQTTLGE